MAIGTGAAIWFYGTAKTVISDTSAIASVAFNAGTITTLAQTDHLDAPVADAVLSVNVGTTPIAGSGFNLYRRDLNISSTNDEPVPDANYKQHLLGRFQLDLVTGLQYIKLTSIPLSSGDQEFYVENDTAYSTTGTTTLVVTPKAMNAKA